MNKNYKVVIYKNGEQVDMCETDCFYGVVHDDADGNDTPQEGHISVRGMEITDCKVITAIEMLAAVKLYADAQIKKLTKKISSRKIIADAIESAELEELHS